MTSPKESIDKPRALLYDPLGMWWFLQAAGIAASDKTQKPEVRISALQYIKHLIEADRLLNSLYPSALTDIERQIEQLIDKKGEGRN